MARTFLERAGHAHCAAREPKRRDLFDRRIFSGQGYGRAAWAA